TAKYDANGNLLTATIKGIDSQGRAFTSTMTNIGGVLVTTSTKFDTLNKTTSETKTRLNDITKAVNEVAGMFQRFVGFKVLNEMTDALKEGFTAAKDFQVQISLIRTISQESQQSFGAWAQGLKSVSDETGLGIADVTKAAYDAISNQVAKGAAVVPF